MKFFTLLKENTTVEQNRERQIRNHNGTRNETFNYNDLVWALGYRNPSKIQWTNGLRPIL